jgi:D-tyrosyl-tRNA(Tyr) deacylase
MKALLQRVHDAAVRVDGQVVGAIGRGILALVGVGHEDDESDARRLAERSVNLRIFEDDEGKMNRSLLDVGGGLLVVSQFTLMGDTRRGRRPSFGAAAEPSRAAELVECLALDAQALGVTVGRGRFGAHMDIDIHADGPVTLALDSKEKRSA